MGCRQLVITTINITANYAQNVLHYQTVDDGSITSLKNAEEMIDAWRTANEVHLLAMLPSDCEIKNYSCKEVGADGGPTAMIAVASTGSFGSEGMVAGVGADIALCPNGSPWRWGHFITPSVAITAMVEGVWEAGMVSAVADFKTSLLTNLTWGSGGSGQLSILNKKTGAQSLVIDAILRPKPTLLNKRLRPVV